MMKQGTKIFIFGYLLLFSQLYSEEDLVHQALSEKTEEHRFAIQQLTQKTPEEQKKYVPLFLKFLKSENVDHRRKALCALAKIGPPAQEAFFEIQACLEDDSEYVRNNAFWALGEIGSVAKNALPQLRQKIQKETNPDLQKQLLKTFAKLGDTSEETCSLILPFLSSPLAETAVQTLGQLRAIQTIPQLLPLLQHEQKSLRLQVIEVLGHLGQKSPEVFEKLLSLLEEPELSIQEKTIQAFGHLQNPKAVPVLSKFLNHPALTIQKATTEALQNIISVPSTSNQ